MPPAGNDGYPVPAQGSETAADLFGRRFVALLFDMDGTVLNSIASAERIWGRWAERHGLDIAAFLATIHGVRAVDTIRRQGLPGIDPEHEAAWIATAEIADVADIVPIPGAKPFLAALPVDRWAIVTSAPLALAQRRLEAAGLPVPPVLVTAEDVTAGKPDPAGYKLAAARLGAASADCLVVEDAPAGIAAGEAAGGAVLAVAATHAQAPATSHPTIRSYDEIASTIGPDGWISITRR